MQPIDEELIEDLLDWDSPVRVTTARGERELYTAEPSKDFWSVWKNSKDELKAQGISVSKNEETGKFVVKWWRNPGSISRGDGNEVKTLSTGAGSIPASWDFSKIQLNGVEKILRPYQVDPVKSMCLSLCNSNFVLNASEVGLGKTYQALAVAKWLGWPVGIVCPAALKSKWEETALLFDILPTFVESYDKLRIGNTPFVKRFTKILRGKQADAFTWELEKAHLLIFDEVHGCGNPTTLNASLLDACASSNFHKVLGLSATVANSPLTMKVIGRALGLHRGTDWWDWCLMNGCQNGYFGGLEFTKNLDRRVHFLSKIHAGVFPHRGVRLRRRDLNLGLPENIINVEGIDVERNSTDWPKYLLTAIEKLEERCKEDEKRGEEKGNGVLGITIDLRTRQFEEILKTPYLLSEIEEAVDEGMSIIVFAAFTETLALIGNRLDSMGKKFQYSMIVGSQLPDERKKNINDFQDNVNHVLLANVQAAGQGLDLHDLNGGHPRISLICPTYSANLMLQAMGRTDRDGKKSVSTQKLIFASDGIEAKMLKVCQEKIDNMALINDGDLMKGLKIL